MIKANYIKLPLELTQKMLSSSFVYGLVFLKKERRWVIIELRDLRKPRK